MSTLIHLLAEMGRNPAFSLHAMDAVRASEGQSLSANERDALVRNDAPALSKLFERGPKLWCVLLPAEDQPTPERQPDEDAPGDEPQKDAPESSAKH